MKQADFLVKYGPGQVDRTRSWITGYTPLLEDFANYSVVTAVAGAKGPSCGDDVAGTDHEEAGVHVRPKPIRISSKH